MARPKSISLKVFAAGEVPYAIRHQFLDELGVPIDLDGWTCWVELEGPEGPTLGTGDVAIIDASNGVVRYIWAEADMVAPGKYQLLLWVTDTVNRFASDLITYEVYDGPGPTPSW